ncbi:DUF3951 domain-containing protein [Metabacillus sp. GX 13764]|uniref:DUF3951 domain-containing protein n=1 Tax=Metabacillus kandeliae TaxID=2900151 RepID=UPI001E5F11E0|nr:DUF3951 domain-containing protein [Metabacillus kandeliae]MCD7036453.1 DUF3951 domain-containing protein [Metabacillus kandeliae]
MDFGSIIAAAVMLAVAALIALILFKALRKKKYPANSYTPFDHITGQSPEEFRLEKREEEEGDNRRK